MLTLVPSSEPNSCDLMPPSSPGTKELCAPPYCRPTERECRVRHCKHAGLCACSDPQALQNSLTGVLRLCPKLGVLPGVVTACPAFLAASRAVQRLAVKREATEACAGGDPEAMAAVLQKAARLGHMSICRRLEVR